MNEKLRTIVKELVKTRVKNREHFVNVKRQLSNGQKMASPLNSDLIRVYNQLIKTKQIKEDKNLELLMRKRQVRSLSGVAVITIITKPYPCPGKCIYCPDESGMPKSYLSNEPAVMRAIMNDWDPFKQVSVRLQSLKNNGHPTDKIEIIVLGGTWSAYTKPYQTHYLKRTLDALNGRTAKTLEQAQKWNETTKHRMVGLTLETRPNFITPTELSRMRMLGCTRIEMGVQNTFDSVLKLNKRGNTVKQIAEATKLVKTAGFKIAYHTMPNLPGSNLKMDLQMYKDLFNDQRFQPDLLKIYPCVVTRDSVLYDWYKAGKFKPYTDKQLKNLLIKIKQVIPKYVRIIRLVRDIPEESIIAGNKITNLRQIIQDEIKDTPKACKCIRCREAGHQIQNSKFKIQNSKFFIKKYKASDGLEYFLSFESQDETVLYAFLRLRINDDINTNFIPELKGAALIRELHTYGQLAPLGKTEKVQHLGLGKSLMAKAEEIATKEGIKKIAVISGIGVRQYYGKLGYQLEGTYMVKKLD
ncbi:MAG: tRNA uridine(34) 5-carboxymethylaminomethyl modification radical SAM/GNAT enzyme Elp3 [Parcubacteria group bacterium]|nr:tRNA uridine(34) 5-carboxymethylaminomethyl modification radical SAM/GNAT enzyme Elp3 [Parcubacteria group bacterium]